MDEEISQKVYTERQIQAGTFLGGPLAAGYLLSQNFEAFNEKSKARNSIIISIAVTVLLFGGLMLVPSVENIPNYLIPVVYTGITIGIVKAFQERKIREHTGLIRSWTNTIAVSVGLLMLTLIPVFGFGYYLDSTTTVTEKTYGRLQHDISFDKTNISEEEVDSIATALTKWTYFDDEVKKSVDVRKIRDRYVLSLYCNDSIRTDSQAVRLFEQLLRDMQISFPNNPITFELVVGTPENVVKRIG